MRDLRPAGRASTSNQHWNSNLNRYSQEEDEFITRFVKAGKIPKEIGKTLDRPQNGIGTRWRDYLRYKDPDNRLELSTQNDTKKQSINEVTTQIVKLANEGMQFTKIGRRLGLSYSTIRRRYNTACPPEERQTGN